MVAINICVHAKSYSYPPNRERIKSKITREDLVKHFAQYNRYAVVFLSTRRFELVGSIHDSGSLAKVANLHQKWARSSAEGAMCSQCQELNALHSQSVDGISVKIPERLLSPPVSEEPFVIDVLTAAARAYASKFLVEHLRDHPLAEALSRDTAEDLAVQLLRSDSHGLSEYELFNLVRKMCHKYQLDISNYFLHVDFGALKAQEKHELSCDPKLSPAIKPLIWNSLLRSNILTSSDLASKHLDGPLRLQRFYSSKDTGLPSFFEYLRKAIYEFRRRLIILRVRYLVASHHSVNRGISDR